MLPDAWLRPDWGAPANVRALMSTRAGGSGVAPFDTHNLALDPADPAAPDNRRRMAAAMGADLRWLHQVHGADVVHLQAQAPATPFKADASVTSQPGVACVVMVADCLPVLFCAAGGRAVGAAHAGWRGLAGGVLEHTVQALCDEAGCRAAEIEAWLGPCIGPRQFEVGADVLQAFGQDPAAATPHFVHRDRPDGQPRWLADLPALARQRLATAGVTRTSGGRWCTVEDPSAFFSFRRDARHGPTGRMAAAVAIVR